MFLDFRAFLLPVTAIILLPTHGMALPSGAYSNTLQGVYRASSQDNFHKVELELVVTLSSVIQVVTCYRPGFPPSVVRAESSYRSIRNSIEIGTPAMSGTGCYLSLDSGSYSWTTSGGRSLILKNSTGATWSLVRVR